MAAFAQVAQDVSDATDDAPDLSDGAAHDESMHTAFDALDGDVLRSIGSHLLITNPVASPYCKTGSVPTTAAVCHDRRSRSLLALSRTCHVTLIGVLSSVLTELRASAALS